MVKITTDTPHLVYLLNNKKMEPKTLLQEHVMGLFTTTNNAETKVAQEKFPTCLPLYQQEIFCILIGLKLQSLTKVHFHKYTVS